METVYFKAKFIKTWYSIYTEDYDEILINDISSANKKLKVN